LSGILVDVGRRSAEALHERGILVEDGLGERRERRLARHERVGELRHLVRGDVAPVLRRSRLVATRQRGDVRRVRSRAVNGSPRSRRSRMVRITDVAWQSFPEREMDEITQIG
jgi:hypothetical protein